MSAAPNLSQAREEWLADLRGGIEYALLFVDHWEAGQAYDIVGDILDIIHRTLPQFANLPHDRFELLTADVREQASQNLGERIDGLVRLRDVRRALDRELTPTATDSDDTGT